MLQACLSLAGETGPDWAILADKKATPLQNCAIFKIRITQLLNVRIASFFFSLVPITQLHGGGRDSFIRQAVVERFLAYGGGIFRRSVRRQKC